MSSIHNARVKKFIEQRINYYKLNLKGLVIYTELGSNNYAYTPIIAQIAGAKKIYAITKSTSYGTVNENIFNYKQILKDFNTDDCDIVITHKKETQQLQETDILTNTGFVRPIDYFTIKNLKKTAVIPLMWETWEFRPEEFDLEFARKRGILVLGTNEKNLGLNIFNYRGFLVSKLLFDKGFDVHTDKILLIGSGRLGVGLADFFSRNNISFKWKCFDETKGLDIQYHNKLIQGAIDKEELAEFDSIVIAEHFYKFEIIGSDGWINAEHIKKYNKCVQIIHICGSVNYKDILKHKIEIYPKPKPFGYMTANANYLGPKATIELLTVGIKVGEIMARNRIKHDLKTAYKKSIENNLIDDFEDGFLKI